MEKEQYPMQDSTEAIIHSLKKKKEEVEEVIRRLEEEKKRQRDHSGGGGCSEEFEHAANEISTQQYYILLEKKYSELNKIEKVLKRLRNDDEYGWCEECGERMDPRRLMAVPDATRCIECQSFYEKSELMKAGFTKKIHRITGEFEFKDDDNNYDSCQFPDDIRLEPLSIEDLEELDI